jgi:hypothetical protein
MLSPGPGYRTRWEASNGHLFDAYPSVERQGWSPVDRWFQVAPGGSAAAFWSAPTGLVVFASSGAEVWRKKANVSAFRFSASGDRLAFATPHEIGVLDVAQRAARRLTASPGVDWMGWTDVGLVARTRSTVELVAEDGHRRTVASIGAGAAIAARGHQLVLFGPSSMREFDLARPGNPATVTKLEGRGPVLNVDLSPDGASILFATATRVYLRTAAAPVITVAEASEVHSLSFSPSGQARLWLADSGGAVAYAGKLMPFPAHTQSARFRSDGRPGLILTTEDGVFSWDPITGPPKLIGGTSREDGVNFSGDVAGGTVIWLAYHKTGRQKETQSPIPLIQ